MRPVFWSISYFVREPRGISTRTSTLRSWLPLLTHLLPRVLGRRHDHRDLAFRALGSIVRGEFGRRPADDLLMQLRHLPRHRDSRVRRDRGEVGEQIADAKWALVHDERAARAKKVRELATARAALLFRKSHEREFTRREARCDERGDRRRRPRHRND